MAKSLHTNEYEVFRSLLLSVRIASSLTQKQVAERLRRPQSFVSKYETGERRLDVIEFVEVCRALKVSPFLILEGMVGSEGCHEDK